MAIERTLSIIKPDAVERGLIGAIIDRFEKGGLKPVAIRLERLSEAVAGGFYAVHRERPFYRDLVAYMTSGPVVVMVLEGENAIVRNREIMGATDPAKAAEGTIRKLYAQNIERNSVHGSDAPETARTEIAYFFRATEQHAYDWRG
jgi:nucleoside-diphosphate kinase